MIRISPRFKNTVLITLLLMPYLLPADDLNRASVLEKEGRVEEAKVFYLEWLKAEENRASPSYGRTLLHLLRMGGPAADLLRQLDSFLPGVRDPNDRDEILKFGGYLADLSGDSTRSGAYFSRLSGNDPARLEWIREYNRVVEGILNPPEDPLVISFQTEDQSYVKNKALIYLLYLNSAATDSNSFINWQEQAEVRFSFLKDYPEWYYLLWYSYSVREETVKAREYRSALLTRYPDSPEAALIEGNIRLLVNPAMLFITEEPEAGGVDSPVEFTPSEIPASVSYLQAGAFGSYANAEALQNAISTKTGLQPVISTENSVFKVIIKTGQFEIDRALLKKQGFDVFRIPPPDR